MRSLPPVMNADRHRPEQRHRETGFFAVSEISRAGQNAARRRVRLTLAHATVLRPDHSEARPTTGIDIWFNRPHRAILELVGHLRGDIPVGYHRGPCIHPSHVSEILSP